jgi:hypothetical protein
MIRIRTEGRPVGRLRLRKTAHRLLSAATLILERGKGGAGRRRRHAQYCARVLQPADIDQRARQIGNGGSPARRPHRLIQHRDRILGIAHAAPQPAPGMHQDRIGHARPVKRAKRVVRGLQVAGLRQIRRVFQRVDPAGARCYDGGFRHVLARSMAAA